MSDKRELIAKYYGLPTQFDWVWVLVARLGVGGMFCGSGWGKLHKLEKLTKYFAELGIPAPELQAPFVATVEFVGGFLLMIGLATRVFGFMLGFTMIVALATAVDYTGKGILDFLYMGEWLLLLLCFWLVFTGGGKASIDHWLKRRFESESADEEAPKGETAAAD